MRRTSEQLGRETASLVDALRRPQARGVWGEVQLRRCVEHAGMLDRCDFSEQETLRAADGTALRPDLVVRLAGGRSIVVDAKVTLAAYLEAAERPTTSPRPATAWPPTPATCAPTSTASPTRPTGRRCPTAPSSSCCSCPGEAFLAPALEHDPALLEHAYARRVHLATPTTLVSLLRTVAHGWQQHALTENARSVVACGQELYARLGTFGAHVDKLGRSLGSAVTDFNRTVGSLERTVLPSARRMSELGLAGELPPAPRSRRRPAAAAGRSRARAPAVAPRRVTRRCDASGQVDPVGLAEVDRGLGDHGSG